MVIEEDPNYVEVRNGQLVPGLRITCCDEDVELYRLGYKCLECFDTLPDDYAAFPKHCPCCGWEMAKYQAERFAATFAGWRPMGSTIDADEEMDRLERERDQRLRAEGLKTAGVWVPSQGG